MKSNRSNPAARAIVSAGGVLVALLATSGAIAAVSAGPSGPGVTDVNAILAPRHVRSETTIRPEDNPGLFTRADRARDAFGFPSGSSRSAKHVHDGFQALDYDEVSELDSAGAPLALTQFDGSGRLLTAVRFDEASGRPAVRSTRDAAVGSARRALTAAGMDAAGDPVVDTDSTSGGWDIHWVRRQDGYRVRGDEVSAHVRSDGTLASAARVEHQLAAAPSRLVGRANATDLATRQVSRWSTAGGSSYAVQAPELQWVEPNAAFDPSRLGASPGPYRLAWVVNVKPGGPAADQIGLVTMFFDAGDGTLIGGDFIE